MNHHSIRSRPAGGYRPIAMCVIQKAPQDRGKALATEAMATPIDLRCNAECGEAVTDRTHEVIS